MCHKFRGLKKKKKFNLSLGLYQKKKINKNLSMVLKTKLFNEIEKWEVQGFWGQTVIIS